MPSWAGLEFSLVIKSLNLLLDKCGSGGELFWPLLFLNSLNSKIPTPKW